MGRVKRFLSSKTTQFTLITWVFIISSLLATVVFDKPIYGTILIFVGLAFGVIAFIYYLFVEKKENDNRKVS